MCFRLSLDIFLKNVTMGCGMGLLEAMLGICWTVWRLLWVSRVVFTAYLGLCGPKEPLVFFDVVLMLGPAFGPFWRHTGSWLDHVNVMLLHLEQRSSWPQMKAPDTWVLPDPILEFGNFSHCWWLGVGSVLVWCQFGCVSLIVVWRLLVWWLDGLMAAWRLSGSVLFLAWYFFVFFSLWLDSFVVA